MGFYDDLGVRRVINAAAAQTILGGSLMPEPVLSVMEDAARSFVSLPELHDRVAERIAELTRNEAACVTCGAAHGVMLSAAACIVREDLHRVTELPDVNGFQRTEIVTWKSQWNGFLSGVLETGATIVEVGPDPNELELAITDRTAGIMWFAGSVFADGALPLRDVIRIGKERSVPVIVDAADQVPPAENLWKFTTEMGADLAIFSGGKGLRGPQASGIIVGRADLIRACRANGGPYHSIGRPAKVGKEEFAGLLTAVELTVNGDEQAEWRLFSDTVDRWTAEFADLSGVFPERVETSHIGQPVPRLVLHLEAPSRQQELIDQLWDLDPRIAVLPYEDDAIAFNPHFLRPGEADWVSNCVKVLIGATETA